MTNTLRILGGAALALFFSSAAVAQDKTAPAKAPAKAAEKGKESAPAAKGTDPSGTWKYTMTRPDGETMERTIKLTREGDKLKGSTTGRNGQEQPIEEGTFKNNEVAFKIVRERDGQKFTSVFKGKLEGDLIKGSMTGNWGGEERTRPWEAKREK